MFTDTFHESFSEAMLEVERRRAEAKTDQLITRIEDSPYGGFRVRSVPAEFLVDHLADFGVLSVSVSGRPKLVA